MYPVKHVLERFKLNIDYSCEFCSNEKETIFHLFFHCIYTKIFWVDVENLITRKFYTAVKLGGSDIMIYVDDYGIEKDKAYIIQLLVIMGKFHIHKMKWSAHYFSCFIYFVFLLPLALFMFFFSFVILCTDGIYMQNSFSLVVIYVHMQ